MMTLTQLAASVQASAVPWIADLPPLNAKEASGFDDAYRNRWRTLLSVDDIVEAVVNVLTETKVLEKTYVIYSSDVRISRRIE